MGIEEHDGVGIGIDQSVEGSQQTPCGHDAMMSRRAGYPPIRVVSACRSRMSNIQVLRVWTVRPCRTATPGRTSPTSWRGGSASPPPGAGRGGVGHDRLPRIRRQLERVEVEVELPDHRMAERLHAVGGGAPVVAGPAGPELLTARGQLTDQIGQGAVAPVTAGLRTEAADGVEGDALPVAVERGRALGGQEDEPRQVRGPGRTIEHRRVQGTAERVRGQDVEPAVADERRRAGHRVEDPLHARPDLRLCPAAGGARARGVPDAGEVEQVRALDVVELQRDGDGVEHPVGGAADGALLQARVVVDAQAGHLGDLLAAQPGNASVAAVEGEAGPLRGDLRAPAGEEVPHLGPVVHDCPRYGLSNARGVLPGPALTGPGRRAQAGVSSVMRRPARRCHRGAPPLCSRERTRMSTTAVSARRSAADVAAPGDAGPRPALAAAVLGFFVITLDAVVVNVALPSIRAELGGGITGLQWVVDGYALMFAALLLSAGALSDRFGARRVLGGGLVVFVLASAACGVAPSTGLLVAGRFVQGAAGAVMMPSSMALLGHAYPDPLRRARAVAVWAMGGAVASSAGPVLGGLLTLASWRLIFLVNLPVGAVALILLARTERSPHRPAPFDWAGQVTAVVAMGGLTYGAIEAGAAGFGTPRVLTAFAVALLGLAGFLAAQARGAHPMVPLDLFRSRTVTVSVAVGFAFIVGYYGLPFVMSLYLQQLRGLSSLGAGAAFLPMMLIGLVLTPFSARLAERVGTRLLVTAGLLVMTAGLMVLGLVPASTPIWTLALLMILVGLGGPLVMPPLTGLLLNSVPAHRAGTASGVFNTSRQVGGALAVAVFGALLADQGGFLHGVRTSLLIAAVIVLAAAAASLLLTSHRTTTKEA